MSISLFPDQEYIIQQTLELIDNGNTHENVLITSPSGSGKTFIIAGLIKNLIDLGFVQKDFLIISPTYEVAEQISNRINSALAAKKENAADSKHLKWLFDFDPVDGENIDDLVNAFIDDINYYHNNTRTKNNEKRPPINIDGYKTPNGYAIIVDQRFDTRELLQKWKNVELKRDDLLCAKWDYNKY